MSISGPRAIDDICNIVYVSDIHAGCRLALYPAGMKIRLDDGGYYMPSEPQEKMWEYWRIFWDEFVPEATRREPYAIVINGDAREGVHHGATTPISTNEEDQEEIGYQILNPLVRKCKGRFYIIRGTEAHVGKSGVGEERLAKRLGALPNKTGQYARYELWKRCGPKLVHALHHIGTTGSQAYESTAVHKELVESFVEAARWGRKPPDVIVRSHRHRHIETTFAVTGDNLAERIKPLFAGNKKPSYKEICAALQDEQAPKTTSRAMGVVTPGWQGKTPFAYRVPGGRLATPHYGGIVVRYAKGEVFVRSCVWTTERSPTE